MGNSNSTGDATRSHSPNLFEKRVTYTVGDRVDGTKATHTGNSPTMYLNGDKVPDKVDVTLDRVPGWPDTARSIKIEGQEKPNFRPAPKK